MPKEIQKFVLKNHKVYDFIEGDLNADKRKDAILVLKHNFHNSWDSITNDYIEKPFPCIVLLRNANNQLYSFVRTDSLINDLSTVRIYEGIKIDTISHNKFTLSIWGGRRCKWYASMTFQFKKPQNNFFLVEQVDGGFCSGDSASDYEYTVKESELPTISLIHYNEDARYYEDYEKGVIAVKKIAVYANPSFVASKKIYSLEGKDVYLGMQTKNFIEIEYEDEVKKVKGFVLKKDIKLIKKVE